MLSPNETNEKESEPETETIKSLEVSETQSDLVEPQNATDEFTVKEHKSSAEENLENKNYEKENEDRDTEINEKEDAENDNESSPETEQENETVEKTEDDDEASTTEEDESHLLGPKSTNLVSDYNRAVS